MVIQQGDIFWVDFGEPSGSELAHLRPCIVIQNNVFNASRINTVVVCAITSNIRLAAAPGNQILAQNEANIPKRSVVNVSQIYTVDKSDLDRKIGTVSTAKLEQILGGVHTVIDPKEAI